MAKINKILLRNGFGFDIESVDSLPLWCWDMDQNPAEDDPYVGVYEGFVIHLPFLKILVGKLV
jgi:hypothetical protein